MAGKYANDVLVDLDEDWQNQKRTCCGCGKELSFFSDRRDVQHMVQDCLVYLASLAKEVKDERCSNCNK